VVTLRYFENHEVSAIAAILGRPVGTVTKPAENSLTVISWVAMTLQQLEHSQDR
jgi:hypothetical protein